MLYLHVLASTWVLFISIRLVENILEQEAKADVTKLEILSKPLTPETDIELYDIISNMFPTLPCEERAEIRKKFKQKYNQDFVQVLLTNTNPPVESEGSDSDETVITSESSSSTVFHQLIAASTFCQAEYFGFQLYYYIKTEGCYERYDFIDDITVSMTENDGKADREAALKICQELLGGTDTCLKKLYEIVNKQEEKHKYSFFCGDFANIFEELLENNVRHVIPEIDVTKANSDAQKIFDSRKCLENDRKEMDGIIFGNSFPYVAEVLTQFEIIDNKKLMTKMLEEKINAKATEIYNPMLNRMRDDYKFHAEMINHYMEKELYHGHLVGSVILQLAQNQTKLNEFVTYYDKQYPQSTGLKQYLLVEGQTVDYQFMADFLPNDKSIVG